MRIPLILFRKLGGITDLLFYIYKSQLGVDKVG